MAYSAWQYPYTLTEEQRKVKEARDNARKDESPEGSNKALIKEFFTQLIAGRKKWIVPEKMFCESMISFSYSCFGESPLPCKFSLIHNPPPALIWELYASHELGDPRNSTTTSPSPYLGLGLSAVSSHALHNLLSPQAKISSQSSTSSRCTPATTASASAPSSFSLASKPQMPPEPKHILKHRPSDCLCI